LIQMKDNLSVTKMLQETQPLAGAACQLIGRGGELLALS
jgi:hypothetical protein